MRQKNRKMFLFEFQQATPELLPTFEHFTVSMFHVPNDAEF